jgi:hypothetical protein
MMVGEMVLAEYTLAASRVLALLADAALCEEVALLVEGRGDLAGRLSAINQHAR